MTHPRPQLLEQGTAVRIADREAQIVRRAGTDEHPIVRVEGCEDRDAARALRGQELRIARAAAPALAEGEWWAEELEGCRVTDGDREIGVVRRLVALPSCEVLEVERPEGGELLVPLVRDAIRGVDVAARRIDVNLGFVGEE